MSRAFIQARITAVEAQITAYEAAYDALASGAVQSYSLDTGQSKQTVTKFDLGKLTATIDSLYNRWATLNARLNGGSTQSRPAW